MGLIEKYGLWSEEQREAGRAVVARVREEGVHTLRLSFADQHGLLRGKTIPARGLAEAFGSGIRCVSTLLSKDTSGATVFAAFNADGGLGVAEMAGAADVVMVPDPTTFHPVPWAEGTARILCDLRFANGEPVPFCSRGVFRTALDRAAAAGFAYLTGLEIEFHLYRRAGHVPCAYANPTINGSKRFQPYSMAPDRIAWAHDNRGAMIRVVGSAEDGSTHLENRVGESAANPYLYMASQLHSGLASPRRYGRSGPTPR